MGILSCKPQDPILAKKLKTRWNVLEGCREPQTQEEGWRGQFWQLKRARKWELVSCFVRAPPSFHSCAALSKIQIPGRQSKPLAQRGPYSQCFRGQDVLGHLSWEFHDRMAVPRGRRNSSLAGTAQRHPPVLTVD